MPNIKYRIYCSDQVSISVEAAKVNTGDRRLWFFDAENNLIALFKWSNILGFAVEGSAEGQVLTDKIPLEMSKVADEELGPQGRRYLRSLSQESTVHSDAELGWCAPPLSRHRTRPAEVR